ncbi:AmmeMemoRadiSam system protein B [bacterium]|nr:AmmeMemoRadiSam system protein B [bacterium]
MTSTFPPADRSDLQFPKLRRVEVHPVEQNGEQAICLRDGANIAQNMLLLPPLAFFMATFLDGKHTVEDIQTQVLNQFGQTIPCDRIWELILRLDRELYLDSQPYRQAFQAMLDEFHAKPCIDPAHAGLSYEKEPEALGNQLNSFLAALPPDEIEKKNHLQALIAPHIDIRRGGETFAYAYREIAACDPADVYLVFGTAHQSRSSLLTLTNKSYNTPLGAIETDASFVEQFAHSVSIDVFEEEILHRDEHSIEFQALWIRHMLGREWKGKIVPILCGSFHAYIEQGTNPWEDTRLVQALDRLKEMVADYKGNVGIIAGVDFSHVGKRFGSELGIPETELERVEKEDRAVLDTILRGDWREFYTQVQQHGDCNNLCGLSPIFMALYVLPPSSGKLLHYNQSLETDTESVVSYASVAFYR